MIDSQYKKTEILIIGLGLSTIPLLRELDKDGREYIIISDGNSVWDNLEKLGRLDFDLVSSEHTSMFSFELVKRKFEDRYPTAREFHEFISKYKKKYKEKTIIDRVARIENHKSHSVVYTQSGAIYTANNVVVATSFKRKIHKAIQQFDFEAARGKNVVITSMGDSANLIASKLIPRDTNVLILTNGIMLADKFSFLGGTPFTLEQFEIHNLRKISSIVFRIINLGTGGLNAAGFLMPNWLAKLIFGDSLYLKFPAADRFKKMLAASERRIKSPVPNGVIVLKYWPIDSYERLFNDEQLEQHIEKGHLLNDVGFFLKEGLLDLWPKNDAVIDRDSQRITCNGKEFNYDSIIDGDREIPNLPLIIKKNGEPYAYSYRDNYMGILPKDLHNVYFLGLARPTTGGLSNIVEMQCLFTHKILTDEQFKKSVYQDINSKTEDYNKEYYRSLNSKPTDHLVFSGFYNDDLAKLMSIDLKLSDCRSLKELFQYFLFPNNAFKYRQKGAYKVEGTKEMIDKIWKAHKGYSIMKNYVIYYFMMQFSIITLIALLDIPIYIKIPLCLILIINPYVGLYIANGTNFHLLFNIVLSAMLLLSIVNGSALYIGGGLLFTGLMTFIGRKMKWTRVMLNDMKYKENYESFYSRYKKAFNKVNEKILLKSH